MKLWSGKYAALGMALLGAFSLLAMPAAAQVERARARIDGLS